MRVWFVRLRTALAVVAAVFLLWEFPAVMDMMSSPRQGLGGQPQAITMLRVWICEDWSGTAVQWLTKQAAAFERANKGVRVVVRRAHKGDWRTENTVPPDVLVFDAHGMGDPVGTLWPLAGSYALRPAMESAGSWRGVPYAVALGYSGYVRLTNENNPDGVELTMESEKEYQEFIQERAGNLIGTVREARKLTALWEAGKAFPFQAAPHGDWTDKLLMVGRMAAEGDRATIAEGFITFLLSEDAQNGLPEVGILPASRGARPLDAGKQALLFAVEKAVVRAANAFDEQHTNRVQ